MTKLEKLRHFVNAAHNYAALEYDCTLTILQEYKEEEYVTVGFYDGETDPETEDPNCTAVLSVTNVDIPHNCNVCVQGPNGEAYIKVPADLFRLLYA